MNANRSLTFKIATDDDEFEQVFRLNHRTFVEEIPQHHAHEGGRLVDRFHAENTYLVAKDGEQLVGMLAVRDIRPFSLDEKLGPIDAWLPACQHPCEVRLLAVQPGRRGGIVFRGLLALLHEIGQERGFDLAAISGTVRELPLYRHLGCVPFGPLVGTEQARYQPMYVTMRGLEANAGPVLTRARSTTAVPPMSFLPGPVAIAPAVQRAFATAPISHRSPDFHRQRRSVEQALCRLTGGQNAAVLLGSGTLANDVVAAQLSLLPGPGAILVHGEFGQRLTDHARRFRMPFARLDGTWGTPSSRAEVERLLASLPRPRWLWTTLCETSTGSLQDLPMLREACAAHDVLLCLDAVSAIGAVPVDLRGVHLATAVSGKAFGAYPGLAVVFHAHAVAPQPDRLPRYLDLGHHLACDGVPFTQSSNLMAALAVALQRYATPAPFDQVRELAAWLRPQLRAIGLCIVVDDAHANPAVTTLALPAGIAAALGDRLATRGFLVSYQSAYLQQRGWLQICLMGDHDRARTARLVQAMREILAVGAAGTTAASG